MELKSEPQYDVVEVTDLDIQFPGDLQTYTLREGVDTLTNDGVLMVLTFGSGGVVVFNMPKAHWYATRPRTLQIPRPTPTTPLAE